MEKCKDLLLKFRLAAYNFMDAYHMYQHHEVWSSSNKHVKC